MSARLAACVSREEVGCGGYGKKRAVASRGTGGFPAREDPCKQGVAQSVVEFWVPQSTMVNHLDLNKQCIAALISEDLPILEPGLVQVVKQCLGNNLFISTDVK